jgi:penicillin-binding protein 1A
VQFARELGIESELQPSLALALGASEVHLDELTGAYATFAAGGRYAPPTLVTKIVDADGKRVKLPKRPAPRQVMSRAEAYVITSMLTSVVREGTGAKARKLGVPAAGKTGTSNQARDAWFVGFTPDTAAGVWVGYDDHRPLGRRESGGGTALPIWVDIMKQAVAGKPAADFAVPEGIEKASIDPATGLLAYEGLAEPLEEVFLEGTVPTEVARPPEIADPNTFMMEQFGAP